MAFAGTGRPSIIDRAVDGLDISANSGSQRGQLAVAGLSDPSLQEGGIITPQYCCKTAGEIPSNRKLRRMFVNMLQETRGLRITRLRILAQKPCTSATRWRSPRPALFSFGRVVLSLQGCGPSVNSGTAAFKSLQFDLGQKLSTIVTSFVPPSKKIILELEEGMVVNGRAMVFGFTAPCQPPFNCTRTHAD